VFYGLFLGFLVHCTLWGSDLYDMLVAAGELTGVILLVVTFASVFAFALDTLGVVHPIAHAVVRINFGECGMLALIIAVLIFSACSSMAHRPI
jgi:TRAP-type C4-dicarboxylate transport system permease large subunit